MTTALVGLAAGLLIGALIAALVLRGRESVRRERAARIETELAHLREADVQQRDAFKALAADALHANNENFLELARSILDKRQADAGAELARRERAVQELVKPIGESLDKVNREIGEMEKRRISSHSSLEQLISLVDENQRALQKETGNLVRALRRPEVRGRWGELQLRKVVEMAGMLDHVDFVEQTTVEGDAGRLRPDMIIQLPGGQQVIVDAKAPLDAYLASVEAGSDEERRALLDDHARHIHDHMKKLGQKTYWREFDQAPEFVVMFLPGENIFGQALAQDPSLIEKGVDEKVVPASPTTLIALLRSVAYGWNQQRLAENAEKISQLGRDLHKRIRTLADHFGKVGLNLDRSVKSYNDALGSLERQVLPQTRKIAEHGASSGKELPEPAPIETSVREIQAPELTSTGPDAEPDLREAAAEDA